METDMLGGPVNGQRADTRGAEHRPDPWAECELGTPLRETSYALRLSVLKHAVFQPKLPHNIAVVPPPKKGAIAT